ncbi:MAG: putative metal-dependent hydrolase [Flavobacteriales bacterium]|nr:putative metal-dependent hydrolase [Flavobacteriales bacterium]MCB9448039.1 putative metal-dependent hydrolase [Flavobacteriales bacterium]
MSDLAYPIGRFKYEAGNTEKHHQAMDSIARFGAALEAVCRDINDEQLAWRYRPDGWTIRQVVHHCADSHSNGVVRFKLALTEDTPRIKTYDEKAWSELADNQLPIVFSLGILFGVHARWDALLKSMTPQDFEKRFFHPEHDREISLAEMTQLYGWHSNHHLAHIQQALGFKGKY